MYKNINLVYSYYMVTTVVHTMLYDHEEVIVIKNVTLI